MRLDALGPGSVPSECDLAYFNTRCRNNMNLESIASVNITLSCC